MTDVGRGYLYKAEPRRARGTQELKDPPRDGDSQAQAAMTPSAAETSEEASYDWSAAVGNFETAKVAVDTLKALINDAVFLEEEAYTNAQALSAYQQRIQSQQNRIRGLEHELLATRKEVEKKDELLQAEIAKSQAALQQVLTLEQELENNTVVFEMHYQELLSRNEEIARLKAVIEGLHGSSA